MKNSIISVLLGIMLALSVGLIGCGSEELPETTEYHLTVSSTDGGSVTEPGEATFTYDEGTVVNLLAEAEEGHRFVNWTGNTATIASVNVSSTTIAMDGDYEITANFEETEATFYTLTVGVTGSGTTIPTAGSHTYGAGSVISIVATPAAGYHFVRWSGDTGTVANVNAASTTITMSDDYSVIANFRETAVTYYTLTMAATSGGSIQPAVGQHSYAAGTLVPVIASAAGGY